jgi:hypothetical protein
MRVFLSSTCYNLTDLRARLYRFLQRAGHTPVLSDRSDFPVALGTHRHDVCVLEAGRADLVILVVDSRLGAAYYKDPTISITWAEARAAVEGKVRVVAFVRRAVFDERKTWKINDKKIKPAHCDNVATFKMLDELQKHPSGIWVQPFNDVEDIVDQLQEILAPTVAKPLPPAPVTKVVSISSDNLSDAAQRFVRGVLGERDGIEFFINRKQMEECVQAISSLPGLKGYLMDFDILTAGPNALAVDNPIRPGDDDGSSWLVERHLTAEGHAVLEELEAARDYIPE